MSETNVTSHDQKGGVTAHTVSIAPAGVHSKPEAQSKLTVVQRWIPTIGAAVAALVGVTVVLTYLGIGPWKKAAPHKGQQEEVMSEKSTTNITSFNQSGGITAHTVNLGAQPRHMDDKWGAGLKESIPLASKVVIEASAADQEAQSFAIEVKLWMLNNGYQDVQLHLSMPFNAPPGQTIVKKADEFAVLIGSVK